MRNGTKKSNRGRGRPPSYDREAALDAIRDVFWEKGFAATALDDLVAAAGMNRPSLYGAFGDKQAMYQTILERTASLFDERYSAIFEQDPDIVRALKRFYSKAIDQYLSGNDGQRGCLFVSTAATEAYANPDVRAFLSAMLASIDAKFVQWLENAQKSNGLDIDLEPEVLAMHASAILHSLGLRARAGEPKSKLLAMANGWVDMMFTMPK